MKTNLPLLILFLIFSATAIAQTEDQRCGTDLYHELLMQNPDFAQQFAKHQEEMRSKVDPNKVVVCANPVIVPVAVHFSGTVTAANPTCLIDKCNEQIEVLNEDFGGYNADITNYCPISEACPDDYPPTAVTQGSCIQFCLGSTNHPGCEPAGNLIGGLAITVGQHTWPNTGGCWSGYMNIFVYNLPGGLLGQAPLFGASNPNGNGFRVTASAFGGTGSGCNSGTGIDTNGTYGLGRTATHEAGHYFGLEHTFAGCANGDGIGDTPSQSSSNFGCPSVNTGNCTSTSSNSCGEPDFWFNFMDYVNDACMWMFTENQSQLMYNVANAGQWAGGTCTPSQSYNPTYPTGCNVVLTPLELVLINKQDVFCFGESSGSIDVEATGGAMPYSFFVNGVDFGPSSNFNSLPAGIYTIQVFDAAFNSDQITVEILGPDPIVAVPDQVINVSCFDGNDGLFSLIISGGTPFPQGYSTTVNNDNFGFQTIFTDLEAGIYPVLIEDANGCEFLFDITILEPPAMTLDVDTISSNVCYGDSTALIELVADGGSPGYTFTIYDTLSNNDGIFMNLGGDSLIVTLTDLDDCEIIDTFEIFQPDSLQLDADVLTENICFGINEGSVQLDTLGGNGGFTFDLEGIGTNNTGYFEDLAGGEYYAMTIDSNGCEAFDTFLIASPEELLLNVVQTSPVSCGGQMDGTIELSASGGVPNYSYSIDGVNFQSSGLFENLAGGNYTLTIQDENDCTTAQNLILEEDSPLDLMSVEVVDAACQGNFTGSIEVIAVGGAGNIEYTLGSETNNTGLFENLTVGMYTVSANDENDCSSFINIDIVALTMVEGSILMQTNPLCAGQSNGQVEVSGNGGNGPYTYSIDGINFQNSGIFTDLPANNYTVYIEDGNGCESSVDVSLSAPAELQLISQNTENLSCFGAEDGTIDVTAEGGTGTLSYTLLEIATLNNMGTFNGLEGGNYTLIISDTNDCEIELNLSISEPSEIMYSVQNEVPSNCDGDPIGGFTIQASGGAGNFTYSYLGQSNNNGVFSNLSAGNHDIMITDQNDCSVIASVNVSSGSNIIASILNTTDPLCPNDLNGSVQVDASGGSGALSYELNGTTNNSGFFGGLGQGNYVVNISDDEDCLTSVNFELSDPSAINLTIGMLTAATCEGGANGTVQINSTGGTSPYTFIVDGSSNNTGFFDSLPSGSYLGTVEDANDCSATISFTIDGPPAINGFINNQSDVSCFGLNDGSVSFGSDVPITVLLNGDPMSPAELNNLPAGEYEFVLITNDDCFETIDVSINQPDELILTITGQNDNTCVGLDNGSVSLQATGGNGSYTFTNDLGQSNNNGNFTNLDSGTQNFMVEDSEGCIANVSVSIATSFEITAQANTLTVDSGQADGSVDVNAMGGSEPYSYNLDGLQSATGSFSNLAAGVYVVDITDSNGCQTSLSFEILLVEKPDNKAIYNIGCRPNPTRGSFFLEYESNGMQHVDFHVFDARGQYIRTYEQEANWGINEKTLELESLIEGVYLIHIVGERIAIAKKVIKIN